VNAGTPIVSVQDIKEIEVVVNIPETMVMNAGYIKDFSAYAVFEIPVRREYKMKIKEIGTEADPVTQTYPVKFAMPSPKDISVLPGMTVAAEIIIRENYKEGVFQVPESGVFSDSSGKKFVWKVDQDMIVHKSEVKIDGLHEDNIIVLSGLFEGDEIAVAGVQHLKEGMKIKRFKPAGNVK
jgi:RND family efflux transporter MFP subunit